MQYRFAICDDDDNYIRYLRRLAQQWGRQAGTEVETEDFPSAEAFLFRWEEKKDFDFSRMGEPVVENTSIADYVWLPLRFEGENVFIDWLDEWRLEDYE